MVFNFASLLCLTMPLNHGKITVMHTLKGLIVLSYSSSIFFQFCYALGSWPIFHHLVTITRWKNTALISGPKYKLVKYSSCWILVIHTCFLIIRGNSRQMWALLVVSSALMVKINKSASEALHCCTSNLAFEDSKHSDAYFYLKQIWYEALSFKSVWVSLSLFVIW